MGEPMRARKQVSYSANLLCHHDDRGSALLRRRWRSSRNVGRNMIGSLGCGCGCASGASPDVGHHSHDRCEDGENRLRAAFGAASVQKGYFFCCRFFALAWTRPPYGRPSWGSAPSRATTAYPYPKREADPSLFAQRLQAPKRREREPKLSSSSKTKFQSDRTRDYYSARGEALAFACFPHDPPHDEDRNEGEREKREGHTRRGLSPLLRFKMLAGYTSGYCSPRGNPCASNHWQSHHHADTVDVQTHILRDTCSL